MQILVFNVPEAGQKTGERCGNSASKVHCTFTPTTIAITLDRAAAAPSSTVTLADKDDPVRDPSGSQYPSNVEALTWTALPGWLAVYSNPVEATATTPYPPLEIFSNLMTQVGHLMFAGLDTGHPLTVRNATTGQSYTRMRVMNDDGSLGEEQGLKFYSGQVLLVG